MSDKTPLNVDSAELEKFSAIASRWWSTTDEFKPLHEINPLRLNWINDLCGGLEGKKVIDVGCGGGILAESMAAKGADVDGIDLAKKSLMVAKIHSLESKIKVNYEEISAEDKAAQCPEQYDVVTCMEMLEHVPHPALIIQACAQMLKPGGWLFCSTINRNLKSYLMAIVGAEHVLNLVPKGTHEYSRLITPSELANHIRQNELSIEAIKGLSYNPISKVYFLQDDASVNYLMAAKK